MKTQLKETEPKVNRIIDGEWQIVEAIVIKDLKLSLAFQIKEDGKRDCFALYCENNKTGEKFYLYKNIDIDTALSIYARYRFMLKRNAFKEIQALK